MNTASDLPYIPAIPHGTTPSPSLIRFKEVRRLTMLEQLHHLRHDARGQVSALPQDRAQGGGLAGVRHRRLDRQPPRDRRKSPRSSSSPLTRSRGRRHDDISSSEIGNGRARL